MPGTLYFFFSQMIYKRGRAYGIPKHIRADLKSSRILYIVSAAKIQREMAQMTRYAIPRLRRYCLRIWSLKKLTSLLFRSGRASIRSRIPSTRKYTTQNDIFASLKSRQTSQNQAKAPPLPKLLLYSNYTLHAAAGSYRCLLYPPVSTYNCAEMLKKTPASSRGARKSRDPPDERDFQ